MVISKATALISYYLIYVAATTDNTSLQTDRSANLGFEATPQSTDHSVPIQEGPAPARGKNRVTWRETLEDVGILVYPSRLPARMRNPTNFLTMSTFSKRTRIMNLYLPLRARNKSGFVKYACSIMKVRSQVILVVAVG